MNYYFICFTNLLMKYVLLFVCSFICENRLKPVFLRAQMHRRRSVPLFTTRNSILRVVNKGTDLRRRICARKKRVQELVLGF
jgi:hypothetical protein